MQPIPTKRYVREVAQKDDKKGAKKGGKDAPVASSPLEQ